MKSEKEIPTGFSSTTTKADITNKVKEICKMTGIVGISAAVIHEGEVVWKESIGYSNRDKNLKVTPDTRFPLGALSQSFTAAVVAHMSHRNILHYDDEISRSLNRVVNPRAPAPGYTITREMSHENILHLHLHHDDEFSRRLNTVVNPRVPVSDHTTIRDLLGHRTGLQAAESVLTGYGGRVCLLQDQIIETYLNLKRLAEPRSRFIHGAINYTLLGEIVNKNYFGGYEEYLIANILQPLGMYSTRNIISMGPGSDISELYHVGRQGEQLLSQRVDRFERILAPDVPKLKTDRELPIHDFESLLSDCNQQYIQRLDRFLDTKTKISDMPRLIAYLKQQALYEKTLYLHKATMRNAARGIASTVNDLIKYCIGLNTAADKSRDPASDDRDYKRVFPDMDLLLSPLQSMERVSNDEEIKNTCSYAAGWATCTLPGRLEGLGINSKLIPMPMIGFGQTKASKVYWNQGVHCGSNSFVAFLPETKSAVIVLTNTRTANDAADWIGQLLLQTLLGGGLSLFSVQTSIDNAHKQHEDLVGNFNFVKGTKFWGSSSRPIEQYMGIYAGSNGRDTLIVWPETYKDVEPFRDEIPKRGKKIRTEMTVQFTNSMKRFVLRHLYNDSFTWYSDWNGIVAGDQSTGYPPEYYILHFHACKHDDQKVNRVTWFHDPGMSEGEATFTSYL